ncbi:MAG: UbiA family prenyltransferase [Thermoplasmata archaeon]|nr:MAG: UbiA family prenyltransferase [Thermoplasmata archaeon]
MSISTLRQWLKLARLQAGAATAITCVFGAILMMPGDEIDIIHLVFLFIIGLFFHLYGFILNEYSDIEVDRFAKELSEKPLIKGTIQRKHAKLAAIISVIVAVVAAVIIFRNLYATFALLLAIAFGGIYDLYGKKFFGADIVLGMSIFFFTIFGALTVSTNLTSVVFIVAFLFFLQLTYQTGVTGGVKDISHDRLAGAKTSPVYLGCRVMGKNLIITRNFKIYASGIKLVHTLVILLPFYLGFMEFYDPWILQFLIILLFVILMWATVIKTLSFKEFRRVELMKVLGAQELATWPMTSILIIGEIGIWHGLFLLFFPIIWLAAFLYIIYGKFMPNV